MGLDPPGWREDGDGMEFSFLDFDEAGGDFESGEDDVEVVEGHARLR